MDSIRDLSPLSLQGGATLFLVLLLPFEGHMILRTFMRHQDTFPSMLETSSFRVTISGVKLAGRAVGSGPLFILHNIIHLCFEFKYSDRMHFLKASGVTFVFSSAHFLYSESICTRKNSPDSIQLSKPL